MLLHVPHVLLHVLLHVLYVPLGDICQYILSLPFSIAIDGNGACMLYVCMYACMHAVAMVMINLLAITIVLAINEKWPLV